MKGGHTYKLGGRLCDWPYGGRGGGGGGGTVLSTRINSRINSMSSSRTR